MLRGHQARFQHNIFVKEMPVRRYNQDVIDANTQWKVTLAKTTADSYAKRFEGLKLLECLRIFSPKFVKTFVAEKGHDMSVFFEWGKISLDVK